MQKVFLKKLALSIAALATLSVAHASPVFITNFSFEADTVPTGTATPLSTGWTHYNEKSAGDMGSQRGGTGTGGTDYTVNNPLAAPADGAQFAYVNEFNAGTSGGLFQDVGTLQANMDYTLTVAIGSRNDRVNSPGIISLFNAANGTATPFTSTGAAASGTTILVSGGGLPATQNTWQTFTVTFTTPSVVSGDLFIALSVAGAGTIQADFDNVQLDATPVPEPSTYALLGGGLALLAFVVLRRKQVSVS